MINWSSDVQRYAHKFYCILFDLDFLQQHWRENGFVNRQTIICRTSTWFIDVSRMQMKLHKDLVTYLFLVHSASFEMQFKREGFFVG